VRWPSEVNSKASYPVQGPLSVQIVEGRVRGLPAEHQGLGAEMPHLVHQSFSAARYSPKGLSDATAIMLFVINKLGGNWELVVIHRGTREG